MNHVEQARTTPRRRTQTEPTPSTTRPHHREPVRDVRDDSLRTRRTSRSEPAMPRSSSTPPDRTARFESIKHAGKRNQLVQGRITVNGRTYDFRSGGHGRGSLPAGDYTISNLRTRNTKGMVSHGVGFSADMSSKYDGRVHAMRDGLRIHPDGNAP